MIQPELARLAVTYNMHNEPIGERIAQLLDGDPDIYFPLSLFRLREATTVRPKIKNTRVSSNVSCRKSMCAIRTRSQA